MGLAFDLSRSAIVGIGAVVRTTAVTVHRSDGESVAVPSSAVLPQHSV